LAGAAISAVGAISAGDAQGAASAYQAQVAKNNATISTQQANYASAAGQEQATIAGLQSAAQGGTVKASQAANNIDVNSGSAVKVQESQRIAGSLNEQQAVNTATQQVYGYRAMAMSDTAQSQLDTMEAEQAPIAGDLSAAGGLLGSASSLGFKWAAAQNPGTGSSGTGS
jgi:hypothetical protein